MTEDIEAFKFNTAISQLMIFFNECKRYKERLPQAEFSRLAMEGLLLLAPFAPHLAEELWRAQGNNESVFKERWPGYDEKILREETVTIVIQVNGKRRGEVVAQRGSDSETVLNKARNVAQVRKHIEGKEVKKEIYVENKIVNFVI